jgi:hypothetical protein
MSIMMNWTNWTSTWVWASCAGLAMGGVLPGAMDDGVQPGTAPKAPACDISPKQVAQPVQLVEDGKAAEGTIEIASAGDLLRALEDSDKNLTDLTAGIRYDLLKGIAGDQQIRVGEVALKNTQPRSFAVKFRELQVGTRVDAIAQTYAFDGRFFVEKDDTTKLYVKREIVREGEATDPLKVGQGPFPLPIGQAASEILGRYDATLVEATAGLVANTASEQAALEGFVDGCKQLVLTPKAGTSADLVKIQLWYRQVDGRWLPRMARTTNQQEDVAIIQLINIKLNAGLGSDALAADAPTEAGWTVREERLGG